jgi:hypothetical protein
MQRITDAKTLTIGGHVLGFKEVGVEPGKTKRKVERNAAGTILGYHEDGGEIPAITATLVHTDGLASTLAALYAQTGLVGTVETTGGMTYTLNDGILDAPGKVKGGDQEITLFGASVTTSS